MVFGKFRGDKKLDAQKEGLRQSLDRLVKLEARMRDPSVLAKGFALVWEGVPADMTRELAGAREIADLLAARAAMAKFDLPNFDDAAALLVRQLDQLDETWNAFVGLLMARQTILQGECRAVPATRNPSTADCQRALVEMAGDFNKALRKHLDELAEIRPQESGGWPTELDLAAAERSMRDAEAALEIYRKRLSEDGELVRRSVVSLVEIITILQGLVARIEDARVNFAAHLAISAVMENVRRQS